MDKAKIKSSVSIDKNNIRKTVDECENYREKLIQYCQLHLKLNYEDACDCVQEAYTALYENLCRGIEITNCQAWLYKVVLNQKNKAIKEKINRNELDFDNSEEKDKIIENSLTYNPDYTDEIISDEVIEQQMLIIISKLNKDERYLYFAHYHDKKNLKIIAQEMGITYAAARQRHVQLKKKIIGYVKEFEKN